MFDLFWDYTRRFVEFSEKDKEKIEPHLLFREVPANYCLLNHGDISREVYFINKGCMRFYYLTDEGKDVTGFIYLENQFAGSHTSFVNQVPSNQVLETIEACELLVLSYESINRLYDEVPLFNIMTRKLYEERFSFAQAVLSTYILDKPEERYLRLLETRPELFLRVPQHILASFLGITPVSLSRIRKRILG